MHLSALIHASPLPGLRSIVSLISLFLTLGLVLIVAGLGLFVYTALYQTIAQTDQIILLRREVAPDAIDTKKVEALTQLLQDKVSPATQTNWAAARNPFIVPSEPIVAPSPAVDLGPALP